MRTTALPKQAPWTRLSTLLSNTMLAFVPAKTEPAADPIMKIIPSRVFALASIGFFSLITSAFADEAASASAESKYVLWYRQPAKAWVEALPVGNGRLGAMVFGGTAREQIQLNEITIWSGDGAPRIPAGTYTNLPVIRKLLFDGKYTEAEAMVKRTLLAGPRGDGNSYE